MSMCIMNADKSACGLKHSTSLTFFKSSKNALWLERGAEIIWFIDEDGSFIYSFIKHLLNVCDASDTLFSSIPRNGCIGCVVNNSRGRHS